MQLTQNTNAVQQSSKSTLAYLFYTFFKIGCISFGGYMALVSLMQKIMVDNDEMVDNAVIIEGITIASIVPGPVAVNIVAYIGYHLKGRMGALVSIIDVFLPACTMMLVLAYAYFNYAYKFEWTGVLHYIVAAVSAIIISTGLNLYKKEIGKNHKKMLLCLCAIIVMSITSSYNVIIAFIFLGAIAGLIIEGNSHSLALIKSNSPNGFKIKLNKAYSLMLGFLVLEEFLFISNVFKKLNDPLLKIFIAFAGISLSLFGGGYVMVPIMQALFVNNLHWLTTQQFIDAIAFSQATPGPILVSATFIGYKLAGLTGAIIATIAMFGPTAILMIVASKLFEKTKDNALVKDMIAGVKVVVIGLIIASGIHILYVQPFSLSIVFVAIVALILSFQFKLSPVYLIFGAVLIGIITKFLII